MKHNRYALCAFFGTLIFTLNCKAQITRLEADHLKSSSINLVENLYTALNIIGDKNTPSLERKLIVNNALEQLFYNNEVIVEDDLLPAREEERNTKINEYLTNAHLFYYEDGVQFKLKNVAVSEVYTGDYLFTIVSFERTLNGRSAYLNMDLTNTYQRTAEVRCDKINGNWKVKIVSLNFEQAQGRYKKAEILDELAEVEKEAKTSKIEPTKPSNENKAVVEPDIEREDKSTEKIQEILNAIDANKSAEPNSNTTKINFKAMVKERKIGGREHTLKSMLLPGMGKRAMQQKTNPIISIAYVGLVGTGVYSRIRSNQQYEAYKTETSDLNKRQELYDSANILNKIAIVSGSSAAVLWLTDVISTFTLGTKNEQLQNELKTQMGISFNKTNPQLNNKLPNDQNTLSLNFKLKF